MSWIMLILQVSILLGVSCIFIFRKALFSYSTEKGKNIATKEDIGEITKRIENVKLDYATQLEETKVALLSKMSTHSYRFEKEYEVLSDLTKSLVELRSAVLGLRPEFDTVDFDEGPKERKNKRLDRLYEARHDLYCMRESKRPFFSEEIYQSILIIDKEAVNETKSYEYQNPNDLQRDYWGEAENNRGKIIKAVEYSMTIIRERVRSWDALE